MRLSLGVFAQLVALCKAVSLGNQQILNVRVVTSDNVHTAGYQMRVKTTAHGGLCDPTVTQSSGYLDIDTGDHLFFWFFEARNNSHKAPLAAWFNGGPGAPSMIGLLMELGPCNIEPNGTDTRFNPYSWNSNANMLFIDQPLSTGYSYSERNKIVSTSAEAARDIYAFLQLFYEAFPQHSKRPLFLTGESYWGKYGPNFATEIIKHNTASDGIHIPLEGLMMGNAIVDPYSSVRNSPEYICTGPYAHLLVDGPNGPECKRLRDQASTCGKLTTACNAWPSRFTCLAAEAYCLRLPWKEKPVLKKGLNPFDVRKACPGPLVLCYEEDAWIKTYLNRVDVKAALGVPENIAYDNGPDELGYAFILNGEFALSTKGLIAPLLDAGIRILNYAGKADSRCDYYGAFAWMPMINHQYAHEIGTIQATRWKTSAGDVVGEIVAAGGGNFIYLSIDEAGHMVPYDQPEATLDIFNRFITGKM